jgi:hypothetical protein
MCRSSFSSLSEWISLQIIVNAFMPVCRAFRSKMGPQHPFPLHSLAAHLALRPHPKPNALASLVCVCSLPFGFVWVWVRDFHIILAQHHARNFIQNSLTPTPSAPATDFLPSPRPRTPSEEQKGDGRTPLPNNTEQTKGGANN